MERQRSTSATGLYRAKVQRLLGAPHQDVSGAYEATGQGSPKSEAWKYNRGEKAGRTDEGDRQGSRGDLEGERGERPASVATQGAEPKQEKQGPGKLNFQFMRRVREANTEKSAHGRRQPRARSGDCRSPASGERRSGVDEGSVQATSKIDRFKKLEKEL